MNAVCKPGFIVVWGKKRLKKTFWSQLGKFADGLDIDNRRGLLLTF